MSYLEPNDIAKRRKYILNNANKVTVISKGDKRVNGTRFCGICGRKLSNVILKTGNSIAIADHYHCYFSEYFYTNICKNLHNCKSEMKKRNKERGE